MSCMIKSFYQAPMAPAISSGVALLIPNGNIQFLSLVLLTDDEKSIRPPPSHSNEMNKFSDDDEAYNPDTQLENNPKEEPSREFNTKPVMGFPLGSLPTPYLFFNRINGKMPRKRLNSSGQLSEMCEPLLVDSSLVNSGRITVSQWIANLRSEISLMLFGRDHILFCGGLWRFEPQNTASGFSLIADLHILEITECLYPEPSAEKNPIPLFVKVR
ncbi:hypothetical protein Ciccas_001527 [Cichlidogyrus casuarinus]|uniref:Uncharacterized protein n=1 Tax=Cichlidogyrus casuarinus TaxID=1844966 RepID=A0ABD2QM48_9PLAT